MANIAKAIDNPGAGIRDRIKYLIAQIGISAAAFAKSANVNYSTLHTVIGARASKPSSELLAAIIKAYPQLRSEWLIEGSGRIWKEGTTEFKPLIKPVGTPFTVEEPNPADFNPAGPDRDPEDAIHFVPIPAEASYLQGFGDEEFLDALPKLYLPFLGLGAGVFAFQVSGDSMSDRFNNGDVFFGQLVNKDDALRWGEVYALLCNDGLVIKELRRGPDNHHFTLRSFNEHFDPYEVLKTEVRAMYRYRAALNFNSSNPNRTSVLRYLTLLSDQMKNLSDNLNVHNQPQ